MNERETAAGLAATPGYRYADQVGQRLHLAGQVPLDGSGVLVGADDPAAQAQQCIANLLTLVATHGFGVGDIHRLTIYVVGSHQGLLDAWSAVRDKFDGFDGAVPPATLLGVACLGYAGQLVEIDAIVERA